VSENEKKKKNPQTDQRWVYVFLGIKEPHGLPPRSSCNCYSPLKQKWVNKI
jgi:hypothetical protein